MTLDDFEDHWQLRLAIY